MKSQLFDGFGAGAGRHRGRERLRLRRRAGRRSDIVDADLQNKGKAILEQVEAENRVAVLMIGRPYHSDPGLNHGILEEFQVLGYPILSMRSIPKDPAWLASLLRERHQGRPHRDAARGAGRVAGELLGQLGAEGVGGEVRRAPPERRRARSVVASSAATTRRPTASSTPIISASATPYSALHDIDANKPGGSIKIRVKTYAHSLKLHEERLEDTGEAEGRAEVPHGGEAAVAARAEAAAARGAQVSRIRR